MNKDTLPSIGALALAATAGAVVALVAARVASPKSTTYSIGDQVARFNHQKRTHDTRALDIDQHYNGALLKGKKVLVTGGNRGLGLATTKELVAVGARVIVACRSAGNTFDGISCAQVIEGVDVTSDASMANMIKELKAGEGAVDVVINNAGYFYEPVERVTDSTLNFAEESKMIEICSIGVLRVSSAIVQAELLNPGGKIAIITSQAGSITWRAEQNPHGDNYGHHMSRAACNMMGVLLSYELKEKGFPVALLHPGFNRTEMTAKYKKIWDEEGAVEASVGAKRVLHEVNQMSLDSSGSYINCEDGLEIPW